MSDLLDEIMARLGAVVSCGWSGGLDPDGCCCVWCWRDGEYDGGCLMVIVYIRYC